LALAFALLSSVATAATTPPPTVVFIGDWITYNWSSGFAANPNWVNAGVPGIVVGGGGTSGGVLGRFQSDVVSLHPAIVHIMIGEGDAIVAGDSSFQFVIPGFMSSLNAIVQQARAANIKVILGIEPPILAYPYEMMPQIDSVIASYAAANNIPVINYGDVLCGCVGSVTQTEGIGQDVFKLYGGGAFLEVPSNPQPFPNDYPLVISPAGYSVMTQMAQNVIATMNLTLKAGWLENMQQYDFHEVFTAPPVGLSNVNTVYPGSVLQFTPVGFYNDGSQHSLLNTNFQGASGTWASSNPFVMYISQSGVAWANSPGTAVIRYTSPEGIKFSEWIMYVNPAID
jgi:hypothetical protein